MHQHGRDMGSTNGQRLWYALTKVPPPLPFFPRYLRHARYDPFPSNTSRLIFRQTPHHRMKHFRVAAPNGHNHQGLAVYVRRNHLAIHLRRKEKEREGTQRKA